MQNAFKLRDAEHDVTLSRGPAGYRLHVGEAQIPVYLEHDAHSGWVLNVDGQTADIVVATQGDEVFVHLHGETHTLRYLHPLDRLAAAAGGAAEDQILAPMPGTVISVAAEAGACVKTGETLMVIESMKMETTLAAPRDGVVAELHVGAGETFDRDALLISMQPDLDMEEAS